MPVLVTNNGGDFGIPGVGLSRKGDTHQVDVPTAQWLQSYPEFTVHFTEGDVTFPFRDETGKPRWLGYYGPVNGQFGYAMGGLLIVQALNRLGIETSFNPRYEVANHAEYTDIPEDVRAQLPTRDYFARWEIAQTLPDVLPYARNSLYRIAWTMWETSRIPDGTNSRIHFGDWATLINTHAEQLVVPCQHNAEVFRDCGVTVPTTVIPYGFDVDVWPYHERKERDVFTVLLLGDLTVRKSPLEAFSAFQRAFPTETDVRLIFKTQLGHLGLGHMPVINDPRVTVINDIRDRAGVREMYNQADVFLWLSKGEGFGYPPVEAMLTGLPVITQLHTGMREWATADIVEVVETEGTAPGPLYGDWYVPNIDSAADALRRVYENRKAANAKAKKGAVHLRKHFSLDAFAAKLGTFLDTLR